MLALTDKRLKNFTGEFIPNPDQITQLDVSRNKFSDGAVFKPFCNLKILILDNNEFYSFDGFPKISLLETLSVNGNQFSDLEQFVEEVALKFPSVMFLSTMKNPMNPIFESESKYERYKTKIVSELVELRNLDGFDLKLEKVVQRPTASKSKDDPSPYQARGKGKAIGFQVSEEVKEGEEAESNQNGETRKLLTVIEYNEKYDKREPNKNLRLKSEGNRFVKNDQL
mmetsp:Transcript_2190/g.2286  ORF Transcript_2190/g.2286 Transcript_2190/m.2286 type:complete len:226 (-) Transcript_2190:35-712(-)